MITQTTSNDLNDVRYVNFHCIHCGESYACKDVATDRFTRTIYLPAEKKCKHCGMYLDFGFKPVVAHSKDMSNEVSKNGQ